MIQRVKNVGAMSLATTMGVLYGALGLIAGVCIAVVALAMPSMRSGSMGMFGMAGGVASIIILPIVYGVIGFIAGLISAVVYNVVAKVTGGVELTLE